SSGSLATTRLSTSAVVSSAASWPLRNVFSICCAYFQPAHGRISVSRLSSSNLVRRDIRRVARLRSGFLPPVAHAVHGLDVVEVRVDGLELAADALDVRGDGVVVQHD